MQAESLICWSSVIKVQAHLVDLPDAAASGAAGLLRPLLRKHLAGGMPAAVFALPAVHVRREGWAIRFKAACGYARPHLRPLHCGSLGMFQAVIKHKWASFARRLVMIELCMYVLWLVTFTAWSVFLTHEDHPAEGQSPPPDSSPAGPAAVILLIISTLAMLSFAAGEIPNALAYG